jgi:SAM-dependent methyltransferase
VNRLVDGLLRRYARAEAAAVTPFVVGSRVLDLGAAEGYVAAALAGRMPAFACGVDVGPFRRAAVPYAVYDGRRLPFADGAFDTTLVLLTLHHCAAPEAVLDEAIRVTRRRLVVTESVYRTRLDRFWLDLLDGRVNRWRHGGRMAPPLAFRPADAWARLFRARGLRVVATRWLGSTVERLVHHPLLYALDVPASPPGA